MVLTFNQTRSHASRQLSLCTSPHASRYRLHLFSPSLFSAIITFREQSRWSRGTFLQVFDAQQRVWSFTAHSASSVFSLPTALPAPASPSLVHTFQSSLVGGHLTACVEDGAARHCAWLDNTPVLTLETAVLRGPVVRVAVDYEGDDAVSFAYEMSVVSDALLTALGDSWRSNTSLASHNDATNSNTSLASHNDATNSNTPLASHNDATNGNTSLASHNDATNGNTTLRHTLTLQHSAQESFNVTLPFATCEPSLLGTQPIPRLPADASYTVTSAAGRTLLVAHCINGTLQATQSAACECPSVVDASGIDWPQTHQGMLLQKPCVNAQYGSLTYWCSARCAWEYVAGRCLPIRCPAEVADGVLWTEHRAGEVQRVPCADGRGEALRRRCDEKGEWGPVEAGRCSCAAEGEWPAADSTRYVHRACPGGTSGSVTRRCDRFGQWGEVMRDCVRITCPEEMLDDVSFPSVAADADSVAACPEGFFGSVTRHCNANGQWGAVRNECASNQCDAFFFSLVKDGSILISYSGARQLSHITASFTPPLAEDVKGSTTSVTIPPFAPSVPVMMTVKGWWFSRQVEQCTVGNFFTRWFCFQLRPPVVLERNVTREGLSLLLDVGFADCKNRAPAQLLLETKEEGRAQRDHSQFRCTQLGGCLPPKHAALAVHNLNPAKTYSIRALLATEDAFKPLPWSAPLVISPEDTCTEWSLRTACGSMTLFLFYMRWDTSVPLPVRAASIRYRSAYQQLALRLQPWRSRPIALCENGALCTERKMYLLPLEATGIWYQVELTVTVAERGCTHTQQVLTSYYAPAHPAVVMRRSVFDSYCVLSFEQANMPLRIRVEVLNVLNEVQQVQEQQLLLFQRREIRLTNLHPNSHYWVNTTLFDSLGNRASNRTDIVTLPFQPLQHNLTLLHVSKNHLVAEAFSSARGLLRCRFDAEQPRVDGKQIVNFPLHLGAVDAGAIRVFDTAVPSDAHFFSCVVSAEDLMVLSAKPATVFFTTPSRRRRFLPSPVGLETARVLRFDPPLPVNAKPFEEEVLIPYNWTVRATFTRPVTLDSALSFFFIHSGGGEAISYVGKSARHTLRQASPIEVEFDAVGNQNSIPQVLMLPRPEALTDAESGMPVVLRGVVGDGDGGVSGGDVSGGVSEVGSDKRGGVGNDKRSGVGNDKRGGSGRDKRGGVGNDKKGSENPLSTMLPFYRLIIASNVFISDRVINSFSPENLCLEDSLELHYDDPDGGLVFGEVEIHRLLSNETVTVLSSHPCVEYSFNAFTTVHFRLRHCHPGLQIAESYQLRVKQPILRLRNQLVIEPTPILFRIVGCGPFSPRSLIARLPLTIVAVSPNATALRPGGVLSIQFNQPVEAGGGKIHFQQFHPHTDFLGPDEHAVEAGVIERDEANRSVMRFAFEELRLLPNAHYRVRVDRMLVKNAMWAQLDEQLLEFELATEDERCVVVGAGSLPPLTNTFSLCRYESLSERVSCACSYVLY